jgi:GR25 family glycosyltransferase involved in LPS biosynthesis
MKIAFCSIAYNRIREFKSHVDSLKKAEISYDKYLFCDFSETEQDQICDIAERSDVYDRIFKHHMRQGLRENILNAIRTLSSKGYDWVCVFEDDVLLRENFEFYLGDTIKIHPNAAHISLWTPKVFFNKQASYISRIPLTGGGYVINVSEFTSFDKSKFDYPPKDKYRFNLFGTYNYTLQYQRNVTGEINTWAVLWYSYIYNTNKLTISCGNFWTSNIGFDGSGTNTNYISYFERGKYIEYKNNRHNFQGKHFDYRMSLAFLLRRMMKIISKLK